MKRLITYFRQLITAAEMNTIQTDIETAINQTVASPALYGIHSGMQLAFAGSDEWTISPGVAYDRLGRRIAIDTVQTVSIATETGGGAFPPPMGPEPVPVAIYAQYTTVTSVPETDGNGTTADTVSEDSFTISVAYGQQGEVEFLNDTDGGPLNYARPSTEQFAQPAIEPTLPSDAVLIGTIYAPALGLPEAVYRYGINRDQLSSYPITGEVSLDQFGDRVADLALNSFNTTKDAIQTLFARVAAAGSSGPTLYSTKGSTGSVNPGNSTVVEVPLTNFVDDAQSGGPFDEAYLYVVQALRVECSNPTVEGLVEVALSSDMSDIVYSAQMLDATGAQTDIFLDQTPWSVVHRRGSEAGLGDLPTSAIVNVEPLPATFEPPDGPSNPTATNVDRVFIRFSNTSVSGNGSFDYDMSTLRLGKTFRAGNFS